MAISLAEATQKLLSGKALAWNKFAEHKAGSITLASPGQRRLFAFLLAQDATKVASGSEDLFAGLIDAWQKTTDDPATLGAQAVATPEGHVWRLERIESSGFGGLTLFGGVPFAFWINGDNWCLEGQNGSGKTSLASATLWALTGKRIRDQDGPIEEAGQRSVVTNSAGKKIGEWPAFASYPASPSDLIKPVEVWVRLTFKNDKGDLATAYRRIVCPLTGESTREVNIDPRLLVAPQLLETGLLMPARLSRIGFGDKSQSLYDAVKMLTGLDQLADIADGCGHFTHGARRFLKYGKENGIEGLKAKFDENMAKAELKATELTFALPDDRAIDDKNVVADLRGSAASAAAEAGAHLATLKSEIAATVDTDKAEGRLKVRNAVGAARAIANQGTKGITLFDAWTALDQAATDAMFAGLPVGITAARTKLDKAISWHARQTADTKFRLKALAAESYVPPHGHSDSANCPLCAGQLSTEQQMALALELAELQKDATEAERKIDDVCRALEADLTAFLPAGVKQQRAVLGALDPKEGYAAAVRTRFCKEPPFGDVLIGLATCIEGVVTNQSVVLPDFANPTFNDTQSEPSAALALRESMHGLERLGALVAWWSTNRQAFHDAWAAIIGRKQADDTYPADSVEGQVVGLEKALAKADPLDELSKSLAAAATAAESWAVIAKQQQVRDDIAEALEDLKDLRFLVGAETASSIASLSGRIKAILERIHLRERLVYEEASLAKKTVHVGGSFEPDMRIDATLVANTSWLRAILWAFVLALREETIETLGANPFPLMVLDDPQTTFDPRNKRKWAQEIARLANMARSTAAGLQLFLTTHEREFYQCMVDHEKLTGEQGLIGGVNKASGVATIVNGGNLRRVWQAASDANDDALARDYIKDVRIYCEDLLKFMLRGEGPGIPSLSLDGLKKELRRLHDAHVPPFDRRPFADLLKTLEGGGGKNMKLINESHHKDHETLGLAEATDVKAFWEKTLAEEIHAAFAVYDIFGAFYGEPRSFPWAKNVVAFPGGFRDKIKALKLEQTGIAAAAKTGAGAGDGIVTVEEWNAGTPVVLPNHEIYQLAAGTLDPVAAVGDLLIVCNHAPVHNRNLVIAAFGKALLARRYNLMDAHPGIAILTGQGSDPHALPEPIIVSPEGAKCRKVVGTIFAAHLLPIPPLNIDEEFVALADATVLEKMLDGTRLFGVKGRSAEPIALEGQFLITRDPTKTPEQIKALDGRLIVGFDENGTRYFKRLRCNGKLAVLESLNPDGTTAAEILSFDGALGLPTLTQALEVVGVLFELPT